MIESFFKFVGIALVVVIVAGLAISFGIFIMDTTACALATLQSYGSLESHLLLQQ
jgi:hypothetical protein